MQMYNIYWSFYLQPLLPIIQITGSCDDIESTNILIGLIIPWLEKAETCFRAQYISEKPQLFEPSKLTISCKLIFQCKEDANDFLGYIKDLHDNM